MAPTEILLDFSLDAVRRIAGHVASPTPDETSKARLDEVLGGAWRELVDRGVSDEAVDAIVKGFVGHLGLATGMQTFPIPVRRHPAHKPVYYLVLGTRSSLGIWHFADDVARATETWWSTFDAQEAAKLEEKVGIEPLFPASLLMRRQDLSEVEAEARPVIAENIARLVASRGPCRMRDFPAEVFGDYLGRVRETVVRAATKDLHKQGRTPSNGVGRRIADLVVSPPR
jgi:hypothetical protein